MQDLMGKEISTGDFVVYAQRKSSYLWMNIGKVLEIMPDEVVVRGLTPGYDGNWKLLTRNSSLVLSDRIAIVSPSPDIQEILSEFVPPEMALTV